MAELEEAIKDAVITRPEDPILAILLEVTMASVQDGRPLFPNPLEEPLFYRKYFRRWVLEGLKESADLAKAHQEQERAPLPLSLIHI